MKRHFQILNLSVLLFVCMHCSYFVQAQTPAKNIASQLEQSGGLAVFVGFEESDAMIELVKEGRWLAHVMAKDGKTHKTIKEAVDAWSGLLSVSALRPAEDEQRLPFHKDSVNVIVVDRANIPASKITDAELHRALAPGGVPMAVTCSKQAVTMTLKSNLPIVSSGGARLQRLRICERMMASRFLQVVDA